MSACFCRHRRRRLGRSVNWQLNSALCPVPAAVTPQLHHLATALCAPKRPGAAPEEQKGCRTSWWWRREGWAGHALGQASREEAGTAGHTGSKPISLRPPVIPQSRVSSTAVNDLQCRKENIQMLCRPYSPAFHVCTSEHPFTSVFPSTLCIWHILLFLHLQIHKPPLAGWSERHFLAAVVFVGRCVLRGYAKIFKQVLCVLTDFAEGFCSDLSQTWYWQMLCKLPTQHWQCLLDLTRDHYPSLSPLPSPLSAQASVYLEQRELSLPDCVVVLWCEQMGLGGQATSVPWILPPSQLFANGWELWEAGKLWVWVQNVLFL